MHLSGTLLNKIQPLCSLSQMQHGCCSFAMDLKILGLLAFEFQLVVLPGAGAAGNIVYGLKAFLPQQRRDGLAAIAGRADDSYRSLEVEFAHVHRKLAERDEQRALIGRPAHRCLFSRLPPVRTALLSHSRRRLSCLRRE